MSDVLQSVEQLLFEPDPPRVVALSPGLVSTVGSEALAVRIEAMCKETQSILIYSVTAPEAPGWAPLRPRSTHEVRIVGRSFVSFTDGDQSDRKARVVQVGGASVALLIGTELFSPALRNRAARSEPDLVVAYCRSAVTARWQAAIAAWERVAPTLIITPQTPTYDVLPIGYSMAERVQTGPLVTTTFEGRPRVAPRFAAEERCAYQPQPSTAAKRPRAVRAGRSADSAARKTSVATMR